MPNTVIALKKSATPSAVPSSLANGELAINFADGKLFYKAANGTIVSFGTTGGNSFGTVNANGTLVVSDTAGDVLELLVGNNITIVGDAVNDRVTIGLSNDVTIPGQLYVNAAGGDEGGQIELANAITNSILSGNVVIDVYQNRLRFFEKAGTNRGAFINLAACGTTVGTDLLAAASGVDSVARVTANAAFDKANAALANTNGITFGGTLIVSANLNADKVISSNNGQGENFKVGDDAWIGDFNIANAIRIKGQQNDTQGYINFGTSDGTLLGRIGTNNLTYGGNTVWHAGTDGAGSGLDADLLDGQHGSFYATSTNAAAAFDKANAVAISANAWTNTVFGYTNTSIGTANTWANTVAGYANTWANTVAAGANGWTNTVFGYTNTRIGVAFNAANNALYVANLAFDKANTGSSGGGGYYQGNNGDKGASNFGDIFRSHSNTLTSNVTIYSGNNSLAAGPITITTGQTVIIQTGARMVIV